MPAKQGMPVPCPNKVDAGVDPTGAFGKEVEAAYRGRLCFDHSRLTYNHVPGRGEASLISVFDAVELFSWDASPLRLDRYGDLVS